MNIVGHSGVIKELENIVHNNTIGHAYLFYGIDGIGKFLVAKYFAKALTCLNNKNGVPCEECESCKTFNNTSDVLIVEPEDGLIKVDKIRATTDEIMLKPTVSIHKVIIINDADCMNEQAQNALLKVLEEPPQYATIILIASNKEKLLKTILSRTTTISFSPLSNDEIASVFSNEELNKELLEYAGGSAGKYHKLADASYIDCILELQKVLNSSNLLEINTVITSLKKDKSVKENINEILDLLIVKLGSNLIENPTQKIKFIELVEEVRNNIKRNANFDTQLDYLAIKIWEMNK